MYRQSISLPFVYKKLVFSYNFLYLFCCFNCLFNISLIYLTLCDNINNCRHKVPINPHTTPYLPPNPDKAVATPTIAVKTVITNFLLRYFFIVLFLSFVFLIPAKSQSSPVVKANQHLHKVFGFFPVFPKYQKHHKQTNNLTQQLMQQSSC